LLSSTKHYGLQGGTKGDQRALNGNKTLALVGDAALKSVLVTDVYEARAMKGMLHGKDSQDISCD